MYPSFMRVSASFLIVFLAVASVHAATVEIDPSRPGPIVSPYIYSQFAEHVGGCIYDGIWVGEDSDIENINGMRKDTIEALRALKLPCVRWPGGCFADNYHWMDGVGPRELRPQRADAWGKLESNAFGTDEFLAFCNLIGAEPYICLNVGSGTPQEAQDWVEYCNGTLDTPMARLRAANGHPEPYNVKFWGIGNENWGCGGSMRPEYYADLYRRFATFARRPAGEESKFFACGSYLGRDDWDAVFLDTMKGRGMRLLDYLAVHYYSFSRTTASTTVDPANYRRLVVNTLDELDRNLDATEKLLQAVNTERHTIQIAVDEWGTWFNDATHESGFRQAGTLQDALFAAAAFHCFHEHAASVFMTNLAQTANVLQALLLTDGAKQVRTPTYYVYQMFTPHRDGAVLPIKLSAVPELEGEGNQVRPALSVSATKSGNGEVFVSVLNLHPDQTINAEIKLPETTWKVTDVQRLHAAELVAQNTYDAPQTVVPEALSPSAFSAGKPHAFPQRSITTLRIQTAAPTGS